MDDEIWRANDMEGMYVRWLFTVQCLVQPITPHDREANELAALAVIRVTWLSHSGTDWAGELRDTAWEYICDQAQFIYEKYCNDDGLRSAALSGSIQASDLVLLWIRATGAEIDHTAGRFSDADLAQWLGLSEGAIRVRYTRALDRLRHVLKETGDEQ